MLELEEFIDNVSDANTSINESHISNKNYFNKPKLNYSDNSILMNQSY
jgi:hypothetical protein